MSSKLEEKIITILKKEKFSFEREKTFSDLKKHGHKLRFDFYIPKTNSIIEVQGQQHYTQIKPFQKTRKDFLKQQEYDRYKISYCLTHKIDLYIIPYWEIEKIDCAQSIFQNKFKAKTKWHNDIVFKRYKGGK